MPPSGMTYCWICSIERNTVEGKYSNSAHQKSSMVFKEGFGLHGGLLFVNILNGKKLIERKNPIYNWESILSESIHG
jgi:hypothetical protein